MGFLEWLIPAIKAAVDSVKSSIESEDYGLSAIKDAIDAFSSGAGSATIEKQNEILEDIVDIKGTDFVKDTHSLIDIKEAVDAIEGGATAQQVWEYETKALTTPNDYKADVSSLALEATLGTHDTDVKALINALNNLADSEVWSYTPRTLTDTDSYKADVSALAVESGGKIEGIETTLDSPDNFKADVSALALEATLTAIKGAGWSTETLKAIKDAIDALNDLAVTDILSDSTAFAGADIAKIRAGIIKGTGTELSTNKSLYDILWVDRSLDESGSFLWDTSIYTTTEIPISDLFTTTLVGTERRKYMIYLDMTAPAGDAAAWTECTIKVKVKIDGTNYRTIDRCVKAKTDLAATAEPGIPIEIPFVAQDVQITMQFDVALGVDQTIYYHRVEEKMEY